MRRHISQAEAYRLKRRVAELELEMGERDFVVECYHLTDWQEPNGALVSQVRMATRMNFRVEVEMYGDLLRTYAVRRRDQQR